MKTAFQEDNKGEIMASELVRVEKSIYKQLKRIKAQARARVTIAHLVTQACIETYKIKVRKK